MNVKNKGKGKVFSKSAEIQKHKGLSYSNGYLVCVSLEIIFTLLFFMVRDLQSITWKRDKFCQVVCERRNVGFGTAKEGRNRK